MMNDIEKAQPEINNLRSYLPYDKKQQIMNDGNLAILCMAESLEADSAGDDDTSWAWLTLIDLPPTGLLLLKKCTSGKFIREKKLRTARADALYGSNWLDCDEY